MHQSHLQHVTKKGVAQLRQLLPMNGRKNVWSRIAQEKRVFELFLLKMYIPSWLTMIARSVHVGGNLWVKLTKNIVSNKGSQF
jgi:hypothetical protein